MNSGRVGIELALQRPRRRACPAGRASRGLRVVEIADVEPARARSKASRPASVRTSTLDQPAIDPTLPTERSALRPRKSAHSSQPFNAAPWKSLTGSSTATSPVAVLDDHAARGSRRPCSPGRGRGPACRAAPEHQSLVVEALRAQQGDGEHHGVDPVGPVGHRRACMARIPWISHGVPTTARRGLAGEVVAAQVELGQRHGLVVEAARCRR